MTRWLILLAALAAGLAQGAYHYTDTPDATPYLADIGTPPPCDYIIDTDAKWANINSASYRVFCVAGGNYTGRGKITITSSGTAQAPRWIRYYNPAVSDSLHPYHMTLAQRAIVRNMTFTGASHWVVDRLSIDMTGGGADGHAIFVTGNSDHNIFSRMDVTKFPAGITIHNGSDYNVVQNSTLHDNNAGYDAAAVQLHSWNYDGNHPINDCQFNRVVNNEIWNVGDGFQTIGDINSNPEEDYRGTTVYNNDMYILPDRYTDCAGNSTPTGLCARGENAIDIKSSSSSPGDPLVIAHNRMWGFRESQPGSGMVDPGNALGAHLSNSNLRIEGNVIWDSVTGVLLGYDFANTVVSGNLFGPIPAASNNGTWGPYTKSAVLSGVGAFGVTWEHNVTTQGKGGSRRAISLSGTALTGAAFVYTNNTWINTDNAYPASGTLAGAISGNKYYDSAVPAWDPTPAANSATVPEEWVDFCTTIKRITAPTTQCFAQARYQTAGPPPPITTPSQFRILD